MNIKECLFPIDYVKELVNKYQSKELSMGKLCEELEERVKERIQHPSEFGLVKPIMLGERIIDQDMFNKIYHDYSELSTIADTAGWFAGEMDIAMRRAKVAEDKVSQLAEALRRIKNVGFYKDAVEIAQTALTNYEQKQ
jgi:hypothetical protein